MKTAHSMANAIRLALSLTVALVPLSMAVAQESQPAADEATEEVVITGSRIARGSDFDSPSPVVTVDRDAIQKSGYANLQQLMEKMPSNGNGAFSTRGNNQDSTANGSSSISLRGLGADATLVLVNGRRVAINSFAEGITTNFVDIDSIPVAAIERVEILKDGSSAIYGSDAVAGVVNIILRDNFQGFETSVGYGKVSDGPYDEKTASLIWGMGDGDSNVTMIFDYFKNTTLANSDRGRLGSANQSSRGGFDLRSSRGYPGRFAVDGVLTIDPDCPAGSIADPTCVYDYGPWNLIIPEAERSGLMVMAHHDFNENLTLFAEFGAQHNSSLAQGAPTPLDESANLTIPVDHPDSPFTGASTLAISRYRTVDAGGRTWHIQNDNLRAVVGLRGGFNDWDWEVTAQRGRSETDQTGDRSDGWVRTDFLQQQINLGNYNPFGGVQNPQNVINNITTSLVRRGKSQLTMYEASISGDLFQMPAAPVRMAAGVEYREESVSDIPDDQFQRGLIFGTEAVSANGSRDSKALFVELSVPLLKNLELSLAGRYDDYSDFGNTTNPKVALRWAPIDTLAFRGSWGKGFRAPSLAQVGLGPSQESQFFVDNYGCAVNPAYCPALDYNIIFSGNPDLDAEKSETFNFGVAYKSGGTELTVDYWDIEQKNKIDEAPFGFIYNEFCNDQNSTICRRSAPLPGDSLGALQTIASTFFNIGQQKAKGIDLGGYQSLDLAGSQMTFGLSFSRLLKFERVELDSAGVNFVTRDLTGEYEYPHNRATASVDFGNDRWGAFAQLNYTGKFEDQPDFDLDGVLDYDSHKTRNVKPFTTINLQFRYTAIENVKLLFGIENVLDEDVPFAIGDGDTDVYGYVQSQHNPKGRFWNAKAVVKF